MGWLILLTLVALALGGLWQLRVRGGLLTASAAALLLGASGYALQGHPGLAGTRGQDRAKNEFISLTAARHVFFGNFTRAESWLRISDALARKGRTADAVNILQNAARLYPGDAQLWVGLGNALVDQAHGLTPPAEFAYRRAAEVAPGYPGPRFFHGLALARSGDRAGALKDWRELLADAPADASWRPIVAQGIAVLGEPAAAASPAN
ncbi:MAG: tetratricopeptide repeat protein [Sphingomicrobium sp.]